MLTGSSFGVELLCAARPDYVCVDGQHGLSDLAALVPLLGAVEAAGITSKRRGIAAGIHAASARVAKAYAGAGFDMTTSGTDATLLADAARARLDEVRGDSGHA